MKILILLVLVMALLWIASIAWKNRRKSPYDNGGSGGSDTGGSNSCDGYLFSDCSSSDGGCGGDGGGGD